MSPADWTALVPAVVALLTAITALVRLELAQRRAGIAPKARTAVRNTDDQSCSRRSQ